MKQFSQKIFSNKAQAICHTWLALQCAGLKSRDRKSYQAALKKARDERSMVKLDDIPEIGKLQGLVNLDIQDWHGKDKVHVGIGLGRGEKRVGEALEALKKSLWIASCRADHCAQIMLCITTGNYALKMKEIETIDDWCRKRFSSRESFQRGIYQDPTLDDMLRLTLIYP